MAETDNNIGRVIGDYRLLKLLGKGGMGVVYKARQLSLDRSVAVKLLPDTLAEDQVFVRRFFREGKTLAKLDHPNIVGVLHVGKDDETHYLVMDYIRGKTLRQLMKKEGRFEVDRALDIARQVAVALAEAHKNGIIHRDIKPANIMIDREGRVKVMDFGLAKAIGGVTTEVTASGVLVGSPRYMSPEQWRGEPLSPQTDIYSLGILLYEMLTGEAPFAADAAHVIMLKALEWQCPAPSWKNAAVTSAIDKIISDMVAKEPRMRYVSSEVLAGELRGLLKGADKPHASHIEEDRVQLGEESENLGTLESLKRLEADPPVLDAEKLELENLELLEAKLRQLDAEWHPEIKRYPFVSTGDPIPMSETLWALFDRVRRKVITSWFLNRLLSIAVYLTIVAFIVAVVGAYIRFFLDL